MIDDAKPAVKGWPYAEMRRRGRQPRSAMICVLEMSCADKQLGFEYSSIVRFEREGMEMADAIEAARCGKMPADRRPIEAEGYRRSRLSLHNDGLDCIVFALGESMANLEFARHRPFSRIRGTIGIFSDPTWLDARTAWFTADNRRAGVHHFNLHLEIIDDGGCGPIPIVIDPDVGHPGGNGRRRD